LLRDFDGSVPEYEDLLIEQAKNTKINVLLLGPNTNKQESGAKLRRYIKDRCTGERNAIYGERKDLIKVYKKNIGKYADLCSYEFHLATEVVDAIIIIPDSAGSLVELGMFSRIYKVHPNTLVLFSNDYKQQNKTDFIGLGPKRSYENGRAFVKTVNYRDQGLVWNIVDSFLSIMKAKNFPKKRMGL